MTIRKTAFILLWFPKPSETFIFREIADLWNMRVPMEVFTLYGRLKKGLSREMTDFSNHPERLGLSSLPGISRAVIYFLRHHPILTRKVLRRALFVPWRGAEKTGENFWAILCAFRLARRFHQENVCHIHAPWASGPATAAWIAHGLTGIPFSFSARAWDIRPPDGALRAKARDAAFIRCESKYNIDYMARFVGGNSEKISAIYNPVTLKDVPKSPVSMKPPFALLAVGRLVEKKGYPHLLKACEILKKSGMEFHLKIAGTGGMRRRLLNLIQSLHIADRVSLLGHVPHDHLSPLMQKTDIFLMASQTTSSGDSDGLPTVISEALLHGLPVIASDVAGIPELIENEVTGLLVPQKDSAAIAAAVEQMVENREWALEMAERGRLKALTMYDSKKNNLALLRLIQGHMRQPVAIPFSSGGRS